MPYCEPSGGFEFFKTALDDVAQRICGDIDENPDQAIAFDWDKRGSAAPVLLLTFLYI
jgi:hypothetical protein